VKNKVAVGEKPIVIAFGKYLVLNAI
jgi:hypothetical protein